LPEQEKSVRRNALVVAAVVGKRFAQLVHVSGKVIVVCRVPSGLGVPPAAKVHFRLEKDGGVLGKLMLKPYSEPVAVGMSATESAAVVDQVLVGKVVCLYAAL